jgi:predicted phosphoribosyltransferase
MRFRDRADRFRDRVDAGRQLAAQLVEYADRADVVVLALPRGGVPVAVEIARILQVSLDAFLVRKLGVPGHSELAMGAVAAGGVQVLSEDLIAHLGVPAALVRQVAARERLELDRRDSVFRAGRSPLAVQNRTVILVDDGLATGSTMEAAIVALRGSSPAAVIVAVPVGAHATCERLERIADRVICLRSPEPFDAVGLWYDNFEQLDDEQVSRLLKGAWAERAN